MMPMDPNAPMAPGMMPMAPNAPMAPGMMPMAPNAPMAPGMMPVTGQPGLGQAWMMPPQGFVPMTGPTAGLDYLAWVDQLLVKQDAHIAEALLPFEVANSYKVLNTMGQRVFDAAEETDCLIRQCCGPKRPFTIHVKNNFGQEVLLVQREMKLCVLCNDNCECCGRDCQDEVKIYNGHRELLGSMRRNFAPCFPRFTLYDPSENPTLILQGPCVFAFGCEQCFGVKFEILTTDENQVGEISKQFSGLLKEIFTDADNFGIKFPLDMPVDLKANLLGSVFLIDFAFFEKNPGHQQAMETHNPF